MRDKYVTPLLIKTGRSPSPFDVRPPTECVGKSDDECYNILEHLGKIPFDALIPDPHPDDFIPDPNWAQPNANQWVAYKACIGSGKSAKDCAAVLKPPFDASKPYQVVRDAERWTALRLAAMLALVPPILILGLGSALGWAVKGFRSRASP